MLRISALPRLRSGNGQRTISTQALQLFLKHAKASEGALASVAAAPLQVKWRRGLETQELSLSAGWKPIELLKTAKAEETDPYVAVRVNGDVRGLADRITAEEAARGPLTVELLPFSSADGKKVYWHSAAHILGASLQKLFGGRLQLCDGPPILDAEGGFFYEMVLTDEQAAGAGGAGAAADWAEYQRLSQEQKASKLKEQAAAGVLTATQLQEALALLPLQEEALRIASDGKGGLRVKDELYGPLEAVSKQIIKAKLPFERLEVPLSAAVEAFSDNPHKLALLGAISGGKIAASPPTPSTEAVVYSLYRCGDFVDLCRGPHVPHTGYFKGGIRYFKSSGSITPWTPASPVYAAGAEAGKVSQGVQQQQEQQADVSAAAASPSSSSSFSLQQEQQHFLGLQRAEANSASALMQRVYGIGFPTAPQLLEWQRRLEEARRRDHRIIGREQRLFFFHEYSPGSAFMLPHGTRVYNKLTELLRREYRKRGYQEVISPLIYKQELWRTSGHLQNYAADMFTVLPGTLQGYSEALLQKAGAEGVKQESKEGSCSHSHGEGHSHHHHHHSQSQEVAAAASSPAPSSSSSSSSSSSASSPCPPAVVTESDWEVFGLKPMNCPGHCLIFAQRNFSYKELPVRLADFSSLHRNEASGALGGMTRLRRFQQDDAHIFCDPSQIKQEVHGCLDFVQHIYRLFGFGFRMKLSTRPEQYVGDLETWREAEEQLGEALKDFLQSHSRNSSSSSSSSSSSASGSTEPRESPSSSSSSSSSDITFEVDEGGGAFYGPKIDIFVKDAIGREHQCATVQLDFQMPRRFNLSYLGPDKSPRTPVIIHRAILGSIERMFGILTEHTAGRWPFWLSPRQLAICTVSSRHTGYAVEAAQQLTGLPAAVFRAEVEASEGTGVSAEGAVAGGVEGAVEELARKPLEELERAAEETVKRGTAASSGAAAPGAGAGAVSSPALPDNGLWLDIDASDRTIPKKVRAAQVSQYNLIAVAGDAESAGGTLTVRFRDATTLQGFQAAMKACGLRWEDFVEKERERAKPAEAAAGAAGAAITPKTPSKQKQQQQQQQKKQQQQQQQLQKEEAAGTAGGAESDGAQLQQLPTVSLPVATLRRVCEHMSTHYL